MVLGSARARGVPDYISINALNTSRTPKSINFWCVFQRSENHSIVLRKRNWSIQYCYTVTCILLNKCCYRNLWKKKLSKMRSPSAEAGTQKGSHSMWWIQDSLLLSLNGFQEPWEISNFFLIFLFGDCLIYFLYPSELEGGNGISGPISISCQLPSRF